MIYKSSIVIERIDYLLMEQGEAVFPKSEFMNMIAESLDCHIEQVWRVKFYDDRVAIYSFAMPQEKNLGIPQRLNAEDTPQWIKDRVAVLQICDKGETIDGVGQKVSESTYYVIE
jgi:hypothetical protein